MFLDNSDLQPSCFQCFLRFRRLIPIYHVQCLRSQILRNQLCTMFFFDVITSVLRFFYHVSLSYFFLFVLLLSISCVHPVWVILMWQFPNSSPVNAVCHLENWSEKRKTKNRNWKKKCLKWQATSDKRLGLFYYFIHFLLKWTIFVFFFFFSHFTFPFEMDLLLIRHASYLLPILKAKGPTNVSPIHVLYHFLVIFRLL